MPFFACPPRGTRGCEYSQPGMERHEGRHIASKCTWALLNGDQARHRSRATHDHPASGGAMTGRITTALKTRSMVGEWIKW